MRRPRLYQEGDLAGALARGAEVALGEGASRHLVRVLRARPGDEVILFSGDGFDYRGTVTGTGARQAMVRLEGRRAADTEPPVALRLGLGISRGERMDVALQKAVELGAGELVPVHTRRSVVRLEGTRAQARRRHWEGVVRGAAEQCGRARIPRVSGPMALEAWLAGAPFPGLSIVLDPEAEASLPASAGGAGPGEITLLVGPEGGLAPEEIRMARERGFLGVRLGPRVLRTETAVIAGLTALGVMYGDLRSGGGPGAGPGEGC